MRVHIYIVTTSEGNMEILVTVLSIDLKPAFLLHL